MFAFQNPVPNFCEAAWKEVNPSTNICADCWSYLQNYLYQYDVHKAQIVNVWIFSSSVTTSNREQPNKLLSWNLNI